MKPVKKIVLFFTVILVPFFVLVSYLAALGPMNLPGWSRWVLPAYFVASVVVLNIGISRIRKRAQATIPPTGYANQQLANSKHAPQHPAKGLLKLYLVFFPLAVAGVFIQSKIPIGYALLALTVPILVIGILWTTVRRSRSNNQEGEISRQ